MANSQLEHKIFGLSDILINHIKMTINKYPNAKFGVPKLKNILDKGHLTYYDVKNFIACSKQPEFKENYEQYGGNVLFTYLQNLLKRQRASVENHKELVNNVSDNAYIKPHDKSNLKVAPITENNIKTIFLNLYENLLLEGANITPSVLQDWVKKRKIIRCKYNDGKNDPQGLGMRTIEPHCMGMTKSGYTAIRAFQSEGATRTEKPQWKIFRVDRFTYWEDTKQVFNQARPLFNPLGDKSFKKIYTIAKFPKDKPIINNTQTPIDNNQPVDSQNLENSTETI